MNFFDSLAWGGSIYGWRFFDEPGLTRDWPADPSLRVPVRTEDGAHSFYWFNECGVELDGETEAFCIEGTVTFDDLFVLDAEECEIPIRSWRTVKFELGHNEIDDALEPELRIASDLVELFTDLGLPAPGPIPVMRADHQVAQKLHAVSEPGSERVRDLVDLQLLEKGEQLDLTQIKATCPRVPGGQGCGFGADDRRAASGRAGVGRSGDWAPEDQARPCAGHPHACPRGR